MEAGILEAKESGKLLSQVSASPGRTAHMADPIRLMKIVTIFAPGGTEGQVHNLVRAMDRERYQLQFACLQKWGLYLKEVEEWNIPVREFRIKSLYKPG